MFFAIILASACMRGTIVPESVEWSVANYQNALDCQVGRLFNDSACLYVGGPTAKCDNAFCFESRRREVPPNSRSCELSFEVYSEKWFNGNYLNSWNGRNAVVWYDAEGKETPSKFRPYFPRGDFSTVVIRTAVPSDARAFSIRLARDIPDVAVGETFAIRNVRFAFSDLPVSGRAYEVSKVIPLPVKAVKARPIEVSKATPPQAIALRPDGMALVDGRPFFPIGIFGTTKHSVNGMDLDRAFMDLKEIGFNLTYAYVQEYQYEAYLDAARKSGMKLFTKTRPPDRQMLEIGRFAPEILAWYVGDDTSDFFSPEALMENAATLKSIDPYRLTVQADSVGNLDLVDRSSYADYVTATDVFMPELYPVYSQEGLSRLKPGAREEEVDACCVATVVRSMKRIKADVKEFGGDKPRACWPIIQHFAGWRAWRYPTDSEARAMAYAAIIHGANGILWYTYAGFNDPKNRGIVDDPAKWSCLKSIAGEIGGYAEILMQENEVRPAAEVVEGAKTDAFGNPSVTCLLKTRGCEAFLFAVNATKERVTVRLDLSTIGRESVVETFDPFGVKFLKFQLARLVQIQYVTQRKEANKP